MFYFLFCLQVHDKECIVGVAKLGATCMCKADKCNRFAIKIPEEFRNDNSNTSAKESDSDINASASKKSLFTIPLQLHYSSYFVYLCFTVYWF